MLLDEFQIFETRQEAQSFLKKNGKEITDPDYLKIREISKSTPALIGVLTKLRFGKGVSVSKLKEILDVFEKFKNDMKREKVSPQVLLVQAFKKDNPSEHIDDILNAVELRSQTLSFINQLQYANIRKELKASKFYKRIENGIISIKGERNWEKQLGFITNKSARFKSASEVIRVFETMIRNILGGNGPDSIVRKIEGTAGAIAVYNKDGFVVAQIFTREASCTLGSSSWCIAGSSGSYFSQYANPKNGRQQYFIWDTSKTQTDNYSIMGVTIERNGIEYTSHLKNDRSFNSKNYFSKLVKSKLCAQDLVKLIYSPTDQSQTMVTLHYAIYGGRSITVSTFKEIFKKEWNASGRDNIDDFKNLFRLYYTVATVNRLKFANYNQRNHVTYRRIHNDLKDLFNKTEDLEELMNFLNSFENNRLNSYSIVQDFLTSIPNHTQFNNLDEISKISIYLNLHNFQESIENYPTELVLKMDKTDILEITTQFKEFVKLYLSLPSALPNAGYISPKGKPKIIITVGNYKRVLIDSDDHQYIQFLFENINGRINCEELIIRNYTNIIDIKNRIQISDKMIFHDTKNMKGIDVLIRKSKVKKLEFNYSNFAKFSITTNIRPLDEVVLNKCVFDLRATNIFLPVKVLHLNYVGIMQSDMLKLDFIYLEEIKATTEFIYNMPDEVAEKLKEEDVKISLLGGLNINESFDSKLLGLLYRQFDDKSKIKAFIKLLTINKIDVKSLTDEDIDYTSSVNLRRYVQEKKTKTKNFIIVCVKENEGIKFVITYRWVNGYYSNGRWEIKFLNDKMNSVTAKSKTIGPDYKSLSDDRIPSLNTIAKETDYIFILNQNAIKKVSSKPKQDRRLRSKEGALVYKNPEEFKGELINKLDQFIKNKFIFKEGDDDKTIEYINKIAKRMSSLYNLMFMKKDIYNSFLSVKKYLDLELKDEKDGSSALDKHTKNRQPQIRRRGNRTAVIPARQISPEKEKERTIATIKSYIDTLLISSKIGNINRSVNNYHIITKSDGTKIYPDASKLNQLRIKLTEVESIIREYFRENEIDIDFISDLDIFNERFKQISFFVSETIANETSLIIPISMIGDTNLGDTIKLLVSGSSVYYKRGSVLMKYSDDIIDKGYTISGRMKGSLATKISSEKYNTLPTLWKTINVKRPNERRIKEILNTMIDTNIEECDMVTKKLKLFFRL